MIKNYPSIRRTLCLLAASISSLFLSAQRVLYIGDSVTDGGWGRSGGSALPSEKRNHGDLNHVYGHSYMMLCAAHYQSLYPYGNLEFFNRSISGNTLTDLEQRWEQRQSVFMNTIAIDGNDRIHKIPRKTVSVTICG